MVQLYPLPSVLLTLLFSLPHVHANSGLYGIKAVKGHNVSQLCMRRGISLTGVLLGGCPMVILQIPVTPNFSCLSLPFPTPFSLESLTFLPSYSRATDLPSASQLTQSSSDFPKALHLSRIWISQEQSQLLTNTSSIDTPSTSLFCSLLME